MSALWSIAFQQNNFLVDPGPGEGERWNTNLLFQPVLPVAISPDWNLVTRPVVPLFVSTPRPDPEPGNPDHIGRTTAFGDTALMQLVSPSSDLVGDWLLGFGPTWVFPTAGSDFTGPGPVSGRARRSRRLPLGEVDRGRPVPELVVVRGLRQAARRGADEPPALRSYFLADGWSVGYSGNVLANWKNSAGSDWTVPIGVSVGKVTKLGKLPVRIALGVQWMAVQPDLYGQKWNFQLVVSPVLPKLIRGNLVDPGQLEFGLPPPAP